MTQTISCRLRALLIDSLKASAQQIGAQVIDDESGLSADDLPAVNVRLFAQERDEEHDRMDSAAWSSTIRLHILSCGADAALHNDAISCAVNAVIMSNVAFADLAWRIQCEGFAEDDDAVGDIKILRRVVSYKFYSFLPWGQV